MVTFLKVFKFWEVHARGVEILYRKPGFHKIKETIKSWAEEFQPMAVGVELLSPFPSSMVSHKKKKDSSVSWLLDRMG